MLHKETRARQAPGRASDADQAGWRDRSVGTKQSPQAQGATFAQLAAICAESGLKLVKARKGSRLGNMRVRYLLQDKWGWVYLASLEEARTRVRWRLPFTSGGGAS